MHHAWRRIAWQRGLRGPSLRASNGGNTGVSHHILEEMSFPVAGIRSMLNETCVCHMWMGGRSGEGTSVRAHAYGDPRIMLIMDE